MLTENNSVTSLFVKVCKKKYHFALLSPVISGLLKSCLFEDYKVQSVCS